MNKWITGLFATALISGVALADAGNVTASSKDLSKAVDKVNYVETDIPGVKLNGYVDVGYTYNFIGKSSQVTNRFSQDAKSGGDFNVNAVKLTLEKPLNNKNELQAGFRVDAMLGEDAGNGLGGNNGKTGYSFGDYGYNNSTTGASSILLEQAYVAIRAPYGNGIDFKVGKQVTWLGYEVIERPSNLNITYGNLFQNAIPLYGTGVSAEYKFSDMVDGGLKIVNGWNSDSNYGITRSSYPNTHTNTNDGYGIEAKVNIKNKAGNANIQQSIYYSWDSSFQTTYTQDNGNLVVYDVWGNWAPKFANDKLLLGFNTDLGYADTHTGSDLYPDSRGTTWWGAALYAKYQFNSIYSLACRADYIHTDDSGQKFGAGTPSVTGQYGYDNTVNREDLWSITLTNSFNITENLLLRAEYRADFGKDTTSTEVSSDPGERDIKDNDEVSTGDVAHTVSLEAVYTF